MSKRIALNIGLALTFLALCVHGIAQFASRKLEAADSYNLKQPVIFSDDFTHDLHKWEISIDALYLPEQRPLSSPLVKIVPADDTPAKAAVRFEVPGLPGTFRSEIALPSDYGFKERWYGERIKIAKVPAPNPGYLVLQWHAVMGDAAKTSRGFPDLELSISGDQWTIRRAFGSPLTGQTKRDVKVIPGRVEAGVWTDWVVHAKWSKGDDGEIQVWQNGTLVWDVKGPNCYSDLAVERTPYLKTGIYRPTRKDSKTPEDPTVVYVADVKIGGPDATYKMVAPSH
jgi:hypothetical protein